MNQNTHSTIEGENQKWGQGALAPQYLTQKKGRAPIFVPVALASAMLLRKNTRESLLHWHMWPISFGIKF